MKFQIKYCGNINWVKTYCNKCNKEIYESSSIHKVDYFCEHIREELEKIGTNDFEVMKYLDYESHFAFNWEEIEIS